jgi:AraC-like DNA-binding protein
MSWVGELLFGDSWAVFSGNAADNTPHAHAAVQVAIGMHEEISVISADGTEHRGRAFFIRPLVEHSLVATGAVALLYVEPQSPLAFVFSDHVGDADIALINPTVLDFDPSRPICDWAGRLAGIVTSQAAAVDSRLQRAIALLSEEPGRVSIADVAFASDLSESRLRTLARAQLGLPLSTWLIWRKLDRAARALADGATLADAAHAGGFADQAQLSRAMRRMFGITPRTAQCASSPPDHRSVTR